jgi:hypothetical protein
MKKNSSLPFVAELAGLAVTLLTRARGVIDSNLGRIVAILAEVSVVFLSISTEMPK